MAHVTLDVADIALFTDVAATRVEFPSLRRLSSARVSSSALVHFHGDVHPTEYRGEARSDRAELEAIWTGADHAGAVAFLELWELSRTGADGRLQLRTHVGQVEGLDPLVTVVIPEMPVGFERAGTAPAVVLTFTALVVHHTVEV